jgi:hypothetical protein
MYTYIYIYAVIFITNSFNETFIIIKFYFIVYIYINKYLIRLILKKNNYQVK